MNENKNTRKKAKKGLFRTIFSHGFIFALLILLQLAMYFLLLSSVLVSGAIKYFVLLITALIFGFIIINKDEHPIFTITWIFLILGFPLFGIAIYLYVKLQPQAKSLKKLFNAKFGETYSVLKQDQNVSETLKNEDEHIQSLSEYLHKYSGSIIDNNTTTKYLSSGVEKLDILKEDLLKAKKFIFIEYFIIQQGKMWDSILEILKQKVKEGVEVRVMYDGTCTFARLPTRYPQELKNYGIKCKVFSPIRPFLTTYQNNRDHRKIIVIDGEIGYTGGINLADEYIDKYKPFGDWKDSAIRIEGNAVKDFTLLFLQIWNVKEKVTEDFSQYTDINYKGQSDGYILGYGDSPFDNERIGQNVYLSMINSATKYIYMMSPYLIPSYELEQALIFASKRGVDVKLIIPHIPDKKYAFFLARTYYKSLTKNGIKIYEWLPGFVHSKIFIVDGIQATVGTVNLDFRSLFLHLECGLYMYKNSQIQKMEEDYSKVLSESAEVTKDFMDKIPKYQFFLGSILKLFAPLL